MLNRLKHIKNALVLGVGAGLNLGCAIVCGIASFVELANATSKNPSDKIYTVEASVKDAPNDDPESKEA